MASACILVGDVGGTNTRLKLYRVKASEMAAELAAGSKVPGELIKHVEYMNEKFSSFDDIVKTFLAAEPKTVEMPVAGCLAVAGPVEQNSVNFTNRSWKISGDGLQKAFGIQKMRLVNDFVANGYGLLTLDHAKECVCLQSAPKQPGAPIACIGAGTGLGETFMTAAEPGADYECFPSEGGHAEFAPRNDLEMELLNFLKKKFAQKNRVSVERVISGIGLANVYEFLAQKYPKEVNKQVHAEFEGAGDLKGKVVAMHSKKGDSPHCTLCDKAMNIFLAAYGSEAGVACLKWIPFGGMYVAGGLTPKNINRLTEPNSAFMEAFFDKGRLSPLLKRVPLYAVLAEDIGQRGAHLVAYKQLLSAKGSKGGATSAAQAKGAVGTPTLVTTAALCACAFAAGIAIARR